MNLHSPIFDRVRIPVRTGRDAIATRICDAHGVDTSSLRRSRLRKPWPDNLVAVRTQVMDEMRANHVARPQIAEWFGVSLQTILNWEAEE